MESRDIFLLSCFECDCTTLSTSSTIPQKEVNKTNMPLYMHQIDLVKVGCFTLRVAKASAQLNENLQSMAAPLPVMIWRNIGVQASTVV